MNKIHRVSNQVKEIPTRKHPRLATRFLLIIILFTILVTTMVTGTQVFIDYQIESRRLETVLSRLESTIPDLTLNLAKDNREALQAQLASLAAIPDISQAEIRSGDEVLLTTGRGGQTTDALERHYPLLVVRNDENARLGTLVVYASKERMRHAVGERLGLALISTAFTVLAIGSFLYLAFHILITQRLRTIAKAILSGDDQFVQASNSERLTIFHVPDEFDDLAFTVLQVKSQIEAYETLRQKMEEYAIAKDVGKANEDRLKRLISAAPVILLVVDESAKIRMFEGADTKNISFSSSPVGSSVFEVFQGNPRTQALLKRALSGDQFTSQLDIAGGSFEIRFSPLINTDGDVSGFIAVGVDVTHRIVYESKLIEAKRAAENASQAKSQFIANVSHEIRTPLGAIIGFTELLERRLTDISLENQEHLSTVRRNAQMLLNLVNDILDLSKIESGQLVIERHHHDLRYMVQEVLASIRPSARRKNITLSALVSGEIPQTILTDQVRFGQILNNVIGNAIKFSSGGSVRLCLGMTSGEPRLLRIEVKDSGIGISTEKQEKIFKPFVQADSSVARRFGGSGLGLSVSRHLANALGGDVVLEDSRPGQGSIFTITIDPGPLEGVPFVNSLEGPTKPASPAGSEDMDDLSNVRILVVEDSEDNQILFKTYLESAGATVGMASGGKAGIEMALSEDFDLVLMDIQMPDLDGYQVTSFLRQKGYDRPIIALTAHAMKGDLEKSLTAGCNHYLSKPVTRSDLIKNILKFVTPPIAKRDIGADHARKENHPTPVEEVPGRQPPNQEVVVKAADHTSRHGDGATSHPIATNTDESANDSEEWSADRYQGLHSAYEDDPRMNQIVQDFKKRLPSRVMKLRDALANGDVKQASDLAHQLKGALGGYGFPELGKDVATLEQVLKQSSDPKEGLDILWKLDRTARGRPSVHLQH